MSGVLNKIKEAVSGTSHTDTTHNTAGPHNTDTANRVDPRVDSDRDGSRTAGSTGYGSSTTGTGYGSSTTGTGYGSSTTAGPHDSNVANKLDPRVDSDRDGSRTAGNTGYGSSTTGTGYGSSTTGTGYGSTNTAGPHNSNVANKLDPRVDSDLDGSRTSGTTGYGSSTTGSGYGSSTTGTGYGSTNTAGPHNSNIANKLDPRVDSDRDGSRTTGTGVGSGFSNTGTFESYQSDTTGHHSSTSGYGSSTTGSGTAPHNSSLLNKLDPRVDTTSTTGSTGYGSSTTGSGYGSNTTGTGYGSSTTGTGYGSSTTAGPHDSNVANKIDPRVDSDRDGSRTAGNTGYGSSTTGTGYGSTTGTGHHSTTGNTTGSNTTGTGYGADSYGPNNTGTSGGIAPHSSSLLNKLDPRVDTSKTGGNNYYNTTDTSDSSRDTFDAAQVPPSQFQKEEGHHMATRGSRSGGGTI